MVSIENEPSGSEFDINACRPAGFWIRLAAYAVDFLILLIPSIGSYFVNSVSVYFLIAIVLLLYKPVLDGVLGGTAGKMALGLRVVSDSGKKLGLIGGIVRSGVFILSAIPQVVIQMKMIEQSIPKLDLVAIEAFKESNEVLYIASYVLLLVPFVSCVVVAFQAHKRGLHDMIADSYVVYLENSKLNNEG
jgi:uncharacterized RDD family membrane protein YckC